MKKSYLSLSSATKYFISKQGKNSLFDQISFEFEQGISYALTGASGVGKSTLLHIIAGLDIPNEGSVLFDGSSLHSLKNKEKSHLLHSKIGLVFQLPYLINELTVLENCMIKASIAGIDEKQAQIMTIELLQKVGLKDKINDYPQTLSGGQQQRVAVVRALINKPLFLLADEPTGNLDEQTGQALLDVLLEYQQKYGMGLIISTHDPQVMKKMAIQLTLKNGKLYQTARNNS